MSTYAWVPNRGGIGSGATLTLNKVPIASVGVSGSWGYYAHYYDGSIYPKHITRYYKKLLPALCSVEKRFNLPPIHTSLNL